MAQETEKTKSLRLALGQGFRELASNTVWRNKTSEHINSEFFKLFDDPRKNLSIIVSEKTSVDSLVTALGQEYIPETTTPYKRTNYNAIFKNIVNIWLMNDKEKLSLTTGIPDDQLWSSHPSSKLQDGPVPGKYMKKAKYRLPPKNIMTQAGRGRELGGLVSRTSGNPPPRRRGLLTRLSSPPTRRRGLVSRTPRRRAPAAAAAPASAPAPAAAPASASAPAPASAPASAAERAATAAASGERTLAPTRERSRVFQPPRRPEAPPAAAPSLNGDKTFFKNIKALYDIYNNASRQSSRGADFSSAADKRRVAEIIQACKLAVGNQEDAHELFSKIILKYTDVYSAQVNNIFGIKEKIFGHCAEDVQVLRQQSDFWTQKEVVQLAMTAPAPEFNTVEEVLVGKWEHVTDAASMCDGRKKYYTKVTYTPDKNYAFINIKLHKFNPDQPTAPPQKYRNDEVNLTTAQTFKSDGVDYDKFAIIQQC